MGVNIDRHVGSLSLVGRLVEPAANVRRAEGKIGDLHVQGARDGVADRGASIRVPHSFVNNGYKGYLEDRRPNSQGDPYAIASQILKTVSEVPTGGKASAAA